MHGHIITICRSCKKVISQCRCMDSDKEVKYDICEECELEELKKQRGLCKSCD